MKRSELLELIAGGENSGVEFKRDDLRPEQLAREVVALANFQGGRVLLGVERAALCVGIYGRAGGWPTRLYDRRVDFVRLSTSPPVAPCRYSLDVFRWKREGL